MLTYLESNLIEGKNKTLRGGLSQLCWGKSFKREMDNFEWWREMFSYTK